MVEHYSLVNQINGLVNEFKFTPDDKYLLLAPYTFDVAIMHIFLALLTGGNLHIIKDPIRKDPVRLLDYIVEKQITVIDIVPGLVDIFSEINKK